MPKPSPLEISADLVRSLLSYNAETGVFRWLASGAIAGCRYQRGYIVIKINQRRYHAHRLAWLVVYGTEPKGLVDHINGAAGDNRICNLRECSNTENIRNQGLHRNNTSGYRGVYRAKTGWCSEITVDRKRKFLGVFKTPEAAARAYNSAAARGHGEFARLNTISSG